MIRQAWLDTNAKISELLVELATKDFSAGTKKAVVKEPVATAGPDGKLEEGGDIEAFLKSSDNQIIPAIVNFIEKLEAQLHKAFQNINSGSIEYLLRLRDECLLIKQCDAIIKFLEKHQEWEKIARISLVKLEHIYYKNDNLYEKTKVALKNRPKELEQLFFMD